MKNLLAWLDPYRQGPWYFKWGFVSGIVFIALCWFGCTHWDSKIIEKCLDNIFIYLPNYLTHEIAGHNVVGNIGYRICYTSCRGAGEIWAAFSGNFIETLFPAVLCIFLLRISGGRFVLPFAWYWLGSTLYAAGVYAADASACQLPLTSSDMVSNMAGGVCSDMHDWHRILKGLGLLDWDIYIGSTFIYLGIICFILALWSLWYYWTHNEQYLYTPY